MIQGSSPAFGSFAVEEIHDLVGDAVANLVRMSFRNGFAREQIRFACHPYPLDQAQSKRRKAAVSCRLCPLGSRPPSAAVVHGTGGNKLIHLCPSPPSERTSSTMERRTLASAIFHKKLYLTRAPSRVERNSTT